MTFTESIVPDTGGRVGLEWHSVFIIGGFFLVLFSASASDGFLLAYFSSMDWDPGTA